MSGSQRVAPRPTHGPEGDRPPRRPRPAEPETFDGPFGAPEAGPPLFETIPGDPEHRALTFYWRGAPDARVELRANKLTLGSPTAVMLPRPGTDLRWRTFKVRSDWRASYAFEVDGKPTLDPLNPAVWLGRNVVDVGGRPHWLEPGPKRHRLRRAGPVSAYEPDATAEATLIVLDGERWTADLPVILDNLIAAEAIRPMRAFILDAGETRTRDYTCNDGFADRLAALADGPTAVLGQSFGGLAAVHAAARRPDRITTAISQSGSFWWPATPEAEWLTRNLGGPVPARVHLETGTDEWGLNEFTGRMREALEAAGAAVSQRERAGGHDPYRWLADLPEALADTLGPETPWR